MSLHEKIKKKSRMMQSEHVSAYNGDEMSSGIDSKYYNSKLVCTDDDMIRKIVEFSVQTKKNKVERQNNAFNSATPSMSRKLRVKSAFGDSLPVKGSENVLKMKKASKANEYLKQIATVPTDHNDLVMETRVSTAKNSPRKNHFS